MDDLSDDKGTEFVEDDLSKYGFFIADDCEPCQVGLLEYSEDARHERDGRDCGI